MSPEWLLVLLRPKRLKDVLSLLVMLYYTYNRTTSHSIMHDMIEIIYWIIIKSILLKCFFSFFMVLWNDEKTLFDCHTLDKIARMCGRSAFITCEPVLDDRNSVWSSKTFRIYLVSARLYLDLFFGFLKSSRHSGRNDLTVLVTASVLHYKSFDFLFWISWSCCSRPKSVWRCHRINKSHLRLISGLQIVIGLTRIHNKNNYK